MTTTHTPAAPDPQPNQAAELITLTPEQVAPHPDNLRDASRDIDALATSIAEVGLLVPLIVVPVALVPGDWPPEITHVAVDGARRLAAAEKAHQPIPCVIRPDLASARETARTMAVTGLARDGLTDTEEAHAVQTMLDLGLTQAAISRATGRPTQRVRAAKKAAALPAAVAQAAHDLTLDQMAALADFTDDDQATGTLIDAAHSGRWDHTLARLRRDARDRAAIAKRIAALQAQGISATAEDTFGYDQEVTGLCDAEGQPLTDHAACPGHRVVVKMDWEGEYLEEEYCADPAAYGHRQRWQHRPGEDEPADSEQIAARREAEKQARRTLIARNRAAVAAQEVRRAFLRDCLAAKSRHRAMTAWALARLAQRDRIYTAEVNASTTTDILRHITGSKDPDRDAATAPPTRHPLLVWATITATYEARYPKDAHRGASPDRAIYLDHLADLGYPLSETDEIVRTNGHAEAAARAEFDARYPSESHSEDPASADDTRADDETPQADDESATPTSDGGDNGAANAA